MATWVEPKANPWPSARFQRSRLARDGERRASPRTIPRALRAEIAALSARDNWRNWIYLAADWLVIVAAAVAAARIGHPVALVGAVIVIGSRQRALANLLHEASHRKLFRNRRLNDTAGRLTCAFPLLVGLSGYSADHNRHHRSLWDARDPDAMRYRRLGLDVVVGQARVRFGLRHIVAPLLLLHVPRDLVSAVRNRQNHFADGVFRFVLWAIIALIAVQLGWWQELLLYWVLPFVTAFQVLRYWAEMAEHASLSSHDPWLASRNWTSGVVVRQLLAPHSDDLFHLTHHLFPAVPHYRLGQAHQLLLAVPEYRTAHHCDGFFVSRRRGAPSVVKDIIRHAPHPRFVASTSTPQVLA